MPWFKRNSQGKTELIGEGIFDKSTDVVVDGDTAELYIDGERIVIPVRTPVTEARRLIEEAKKK